MRQGPLAPSRVLDLCGAEGDAITRIFADLGADVLKIEPPGGSPARTVSPTIAGAGVRFALDNAGKRSAILDSDRGADRDRLMELAATADIVVDCGCSGGLAEFGTSCAELAARFPRLVALSVSDFGSSGPHASRVATDAVFYAMSTPLSRSGPTAGRPVLPPYGLASATAAVQAAWACLVAHYHQLRTGRGDFIDFSRFEAVVQSLDPPFGSEGQAAAGVKRSAELWRGRPRNQHIYPIFRCGDGHVRICLLSPRQWRGMRAWLGEPEQFADPKFDTIAARYAASRELNTLIAELFAPVPMADLVREGQARGVPIAAVLSPARALGSEHFREAGALTETTIASGIASGNIPGTTPGITITIPRSPFVVDGTHTGPAGPAPQAGADEPVWAATQSAAAQRMAGDRTGDWTLSRPFDGIRILDLGVIVAGGELGRLFADLGAEVIKVESAAYPDGLRQTPPGWPMSRSWALTHRNEYSLGLDLRHPDGAEIFARMVAESDAVFANFKPGTLAALGFDYERLCAINPRVVLAESSAFGATGPWSARMGYGPLVRATTGVSRLWTSSDPADDDFYDATTIFPDHVVARITAIAALAALVRRDRTGRGAAVHVSQAEVAVNQLAAAFVTEAARSAGLPIGEDAAVHGVYPCAGDDEWCVISIRSEADRTAIAEAIGIGELPCESSDLDAAISAWTATEDKSAVADLLQRAGVPAAAMNRAVDVLADPQIRYRKLFTDLTHPLFTEPMPTETGPAPYTHIPPAELRPAPTPGQHTREICQKVLALDTGEIDSLIASGALFGPTEVPGPGGRGDGC